MSLHYRAYQTAPMMESYRGQDIVTWQGTIERQLDKMVDEYVEARNEAYATKIRQFLQVWREHPFTGSINVETINALLAATAVPAVDEWKLQNYFSLIRDQLRKLKASVEELPTLGTPEAPPSPSRSGPASDFGAQEEEPENPLDEPLEEPVEDEAP